MENIKNLFSKIDKTKLTLGIVLGHHNARMAVLENEHMKIIFDDSSHSVIPLIVSFTNFGTVFGTKAKKNLVVDPSNTVTCITELIGKNVDEIFKTKNKLLTCKIVNKSNKAFILVKNAIGKGIFVDRIYFLIIQNLKNIAEQHIGKKIINVVVATPISFTEKQLQIVEWALKSAGFNVLFMISEPVASVTSFQLTLSKKVLVFSLNRHFLEVSVLQKDNNEFKILSNFKTFDVGGEHFNTCLIEYILKKYKQMFDQDLSADKDAMKNLRSQCEMTKTNLTTMTTNSIKLNLKNFTFDKIITRSKFESVCNGIFNLAIDAVEHVLLQNQLKTSEIDEIILTGASTKIPKIRQLLSAYFFHKQLLTSHQPQETVAYGTALYAAFCNKENVKNTEKLNYLVIPSIPVSFGFVVDDENAELMIPQNTVFPFSKSKNVEIFSKKHKSFKIIGDKNHLNKNSFLFNQIEFFESYSETFKLKVRFNFNVSGDLFVFIYDEKKSKNIFSRTVKYESIYKYLNKKINKQMEEIEHENVSLIDKIKNSETLNKVLCSVIKTQIKIKDINAKLNYLSLLKINLSTQEKQLKYIQQKVNQKGTPITKQLIYKQNKITKNITNTSFDNANLKNVILNQNSKGTFGDITFQIDIDLNSPDEEIESQIETPTIVHNNSATKINYLHCLALFGALPIFIYYLKQFK